MHSPYVLLAAVVCRSLTCNFSLHFSDILETCLWREKIRFEDSSANYQYSK